MTADRWAAKADALWDTFSDLVTDCDESDLAKVAAALRDAFNEGLTAAANRIECSTRRDLANAEAIFALREKP